MLPVSPSAGRLSIHALWNFIELSSVLETYLSSINS